MATPPAVKAVPQLDIAQFAGRWHEIARLPSPLQRLTDRDIRLDIEPLDADQYRLRRSCTDPDGSERRQDFHARRRYPVQEPGQFQRTAAPAWAQWLPSTWKELWVLAVDRQYQWLMLGEPRLRELWMFAREPQMERQVLEALKSTARGLGYDLAPLVVSGQLRSFQMV
jgi:apolipoprotein D and lipocalin family protein